MCVSIDIAIIAMDNSSLATRTSYQRELATPQVIDISYKYRDPPVIAVECHGYKTYER
jgi:hypothetical protein